MRNIFFKLSNSIQQTYSAANPETVFKNGSTLQNQSLKERKRAFLLHFVIYIYPIAIFIITSC